VQPARADDADTCAKASGDVAIAACTRLIASGRYKGRDLAIFYTNRAYMWRAKGDLDGAIADYDQAIRHDPKYTTAYINRGNAWGTKRDVDRAIADLNEAIRLDPKNALAYRKRGDMWGARGYNERAIADYTEVIRLDPKDALSYLGRCSVRAIAGRNLPQALSDCDQALRLRPNDVTTMGTRGLLYLRLGRLDDAIVEFDAALKLAPKVTTAFLLFGRGIAKQRKGDTAGGDFDMAAAKANNANIAEEYAKYGLK